MGNGLTDAALALQLASMCRRNLNFARKSRKVLQK